MVRQSAFTLLESVIVLGLVSVMVAFGAINLRESTENNRERYFWQQMKENWQEAQVRSENNNTQTTIDKYPDGIRFHWMDLKKGPQDNYIKIPTTLSVKSFPTVIVRPNGYAKANSEIFYSKKHNKTYFMRVQLGWGGYDLETKDGICTK